VDLAHHVAGNLEIPTANAERGVGAILNALRMIGPRARPQFPFAPYLPT